MNKDMENKGLLFLLVTAMFFWGGAWPAGKVVAGAARAEVVMFWRFLFAAIPFLPLPLIFKFSIKIPKKIIGLVILAVFLYVGYNYLFFLGLRKGMPGAGGVIVTSLVPILAFLFTILIYRLKIKLIEFIGLIMGFAGGCILLELWRVDIRTLLGSGNLYFIFASSFWGLLTVIVSRIQKTISVWVCNFYLYIFSCIVTFFIALPFGIFSYTGNLLKISLGLIYLGLVSTTFGTSVYIYAAGKLGGHKAGSFVFLVPVSAVISSMIIFKEVPQLNTIVGGFINIIAVYLINKKSRGVKS